MPISANMQVLRETRQLPQSFDISRVPFSWTKKQMALGTRPTNTYCALVEIGKQQPCEPVAVMPINVSDFDKP